MPDSINQSLPVSLLLNVLRSIFPVKALLYIGAGAGHSVEERIQGWTAENVLLIEANPHYQEQLSDYTNLFPGWLSASVLIGDIETETNFYHASNPLESGVIPPQELKPVWQNLSEESCEKLSQTTLDALLGEANYKQISSNINWVVIDCLPALSILKGANKYLNNWDLMQIRVILNSDLENIEGGHLWEVEDCLRPMGFRCIAVTESNHPAIGEALFYKDWKQLLISKNWQITQDRDEQSRVIEKNVALVQQLTKERNELAKSAAEQHAQIQELIKEHDEQDKQSVEWQANIQQLTQALDEKSKQVQERQEKIEKLDLERDTRIQKIIQLQEEVKTLSEEVLTHSQRHRMLNEEMLKAEAQVELIKDVLLHE